MKTPVTGVDVGRRRQRVARASTASGVTGVSTTSRATPQSPAQGRPLELDMTPWDITVYRVMTAVSAAAVVLVVSISSVLGMRPALGLGLVAIASAAYFGLCWQLLERRVAPVPHWVPFVNATIEASIGTALLFVLALVKDASWAVTSPTVTVYSLSILLVTIRMRPGIVVATTGVIAVEYLVLYYAFLGPRQDPSLMAALPTLQAWGAWDRVFWLSCMGVVAAFASYKIRALALFGGIQASQRQWIEKEFGRYVSKDVVHAILRGEAVVGQAERREVTVLFCDLRNFTSMCERESPEVVVSILNRFFEQVCRVIEAHGGTVNKFLGDGVLALFGAPDEHPNHARAASEAAHDLLVIADEMRRGGIPGFDVGIGLDTGDVLVGAVGATNRVEYTAIGSVVNRAARLQGLGSGRHRIVLSAACLSGLGPNANVVSLGPQNLKGFAAPEPVYAFRHS